MENKLLPAADGEEKEDSGKGRNTASNCEAKCQAGDPDLEWQISGISILGQISDKSKIDFNSGTNYVRKKYFNSGTCG